MDQGFISDEVTTGFINLKGVKDEIYGTKTRQNLELRTVRNNTRGSSHGESSSESEGQTNGSSFTESASESESAGVGYRNDQKPAGEVLARRMFGLKDEASGWTQSRQVSRGQSRTESNSSSYTTSQGRSRSESETSGESETRVSVAEEYQELSSRTFWSLQELEYMEVAKLKNQGVAQAFIKLWGEEPQTVQIDEVITPAFTAKSEHLTETARLRAIATNGSHFTPIEQLETERSQRQIAAFGETLKFSSQLDAGDDTALETIIDADDPFT